METIDKGRATPGTRKNAAQVSIFDTHGRDDGDALGDTWRSKLICGDNILVMASLLERYSGQVHLIYLDPSLSTRCDSPLAINDGDGSERIENEPTVAQDEIAPDTSGCLLNRYLRTMSEQLMLVRALLSSEGHLVVHVTPRVSPYVRLLLDEVFGNANFRNEIVVNRSVAKRSPRTRKAIAALPQGHDVLLWYSAQPTTKVPSLSIPSTVWDDIEIHDHSTDDPAGNHEDLLTRVVNWLSRPDQVVADFCCGFGTTLAVAEKTWTQVDRLRFRPMGNSPHSQATARHGELQALRRSRPRQA